MQIKGNIGVANAVLGRLREVKICLPHFVDSDVEGLDSTLKGINFRVKDLHAIKQAFELATDYLGRGAFYYNGQYSSGKIIKLDYQVFYFDKVGTYGLRPACGCPIFQ